jgi:TraB family protein
MQWDSTRVERVLAEAGVYLTQPNFSFSFSSKSMGLRHLRDSIRREERLSHMPNDEKLQQVLSPELYGRYAALRARYFPRNDAIEELRPLFAMQSMRNEVQQEAGLASADAIFDQIEKLARRNRKLQRIDAVVVEKFELEYDESVARMEALMNSLPPDKERDCFEHELRRMEIDLDAIKRRANEWASGRIGEFRAVQLQEGDNPCQAMFSTSSEGEVFEDLARQSQEKWLSGAEEGLTNHRTSFAVLDISDLLSDDGLLAKLAAKGYSVRAPD